MPRDAKHRLEINAESKAWAEHDREPWSADDLEQLVGFWDGTEETLWEIAELLGRTIEACREMYYKFTRTPHVKRVTTTTTVVKQWLVGFCFSCGRFDDVYFDGHVNLCADCATNK